MSTPRSLHIPDGYITLAVVMTSGTESKGFVGGQNPREGKGVYMEPPETKTGSRKQRQSQTACDQREKKGLA